MLVEEDSSSFNVICMKLKPPAHNQEHMQLHTGICCELTSGLWCALVHIEERLSLRYVKLHNE